MKVLGKCPLVVGGNTAPSLLRVRWFPSFTSFLTTRPVWNESKMKYLCFGEEVCKTTGRKHWQGCVYFYDKCSIRQAQKLLDIGKSHIETYQKSDSMEDCFEYCKKDEKYVEFGIKPEQGKRRDLIALKDELLNTELTCDDICLDNPIMYHQYGRTLNKIEDLKMRKKFRTEMTEGIWYYGATGTGKSHIAYTGYNPSTHYNWKDDGGWQDGYIQQETVIINEFRGEMKYKDLLLLVDKYPYEIRRRNREPMPFTSKKVIITSSLHPRDIYKNLNAKDSLEQLERRFRFVELV